MPLLLLTPREDIRDTFLLADAAKELGWEVQRASSYQPNRSQYPQEEVVLYGETFFTTLVAQKLSYVVLEPDFDMLAKFPQRYLKRDVQSMTLEQARQFKTPVFVKPADGNKAFDSQVYENGSKLPSKYLAKTLPVLVSAPVNWSVEYRCFVLERQLVAYSVYARNGQLARDEAGNWPASETEQQDAVAFCTKILQDATVELPPVVVLDIGILSERVWALVEPNPVSSSGIYGCDPKKVLIALQRACIREEAISMADRRWIVNRPL